jgi:hypothetical protein
MKHEAVSFRQALVELGMSTMRRRRDDPKRRAAERVIRWVSQQQQKLNARIRELDEQMEFADELGDSQLAESFWREWRLVADLRDDLSRAEYLAEFVELRFAIEQIAEGL